jgi:excinuclease ABC subunit A
MDEINEIRIRGARTHNLKNVNLDLPRNRLIVITGLSGSGKSSLAFDTLYAEGQRRYVESLSAYARQFLQRIEKPDVDLIEGLSPAISIEQKATSHNPRSTVGTVTEIHDYLRLLFARAGTPYCAEHQQALESQTVSQMVDHVLALSEDSRLMILAPVVADRKGEQLELFAELRAQGFARLRVDGQIYEIDALPKLAKTRKHSVDVVIDRLKVRADMRQRLAESFETALRHADGRAIAYEMDSEREHFFSARFACPVCSYSLPELEPRIFSFNSPMGACQKCDGLGVIQFFDPKRIVGHPELSLAAGAIRAWDRRNPFYFQMLSRWLRTTAFDVEVPFSDLPERIQQIILYGSGREQLPFDLRQRAWPAQHSPAQLRRHRRQPRTALQGNRLAGRSRRAGAPDQQPELSVVPRQPPARRSAQRARRHPRQCAHPARAQPPAACRSARLLRLAAAARQQGAGRRESAQGNRQPSAVPDQRRPRLSVARPFGGNALRRRGAAHPPGFADRLGADRRTLCPRRTVDRPASARQRATAENAAAVARHRQHGDRRRTRRGSDPQRRLRRRHRPRRRRAWRLHRRRRTAGSNHRQPGIDDRRLPRRPAAHRHARQATPTRPRADCCSIVGARGNNLRNVSVELPVGLFTCITGVSGSGKSTLINDTLYAAAARHLYGSNAEPAEHDAIVGLDHFDKVINVDQSPIGRTPRSNPATYTGLLTPIRELFSGIPEARARGYGPGRFSFNVKGGRCEACQGDGVIKVEMHFLPDIYVPCDVCHGKRYNRETLEIQYKGSNVYQILQMTVEVAREFFDAVPVVARKLQTLVDVGLSYITLGQSATTLSGGEAQRVKLALELSKRDTGRTLYILDEPTTGLHFQDIEMLLTVLHRLVDHGNTVLVIEHNLDVIKTADWLLDLGPEGGAGGGRLLAAGPPEKIAAVTESHSGRFLKPLLRPRDATDSSAR